MLRGCWAKIWANLIMSASLLSVFARSIIASAESCWSQGPAAARSVVNAVTEMGLHSTLPPAASYGDKSQLLFSQFETRQTSSCNIFEVIMDLHRLSPRAQSSLK